MKIVNRILLQLTVRGIPPLTFVVGCREAIRFEGYEPDSLLSSWCVLTVVCPWVVVTPSSSFLHPRENKSHERVSQAIYSRIDIPSLVGTRCLRQRRQYRGGPARPG